MTLSTRPSSPGPAIRLAAALTVLAAVAGCNSPPPPAPAGPDEQYTIALTTPADAARSALGVLRAELLASARKDRRDAAKHLSALRERIAAIDVITADVRKMPQVVRLNPTEEQIADMVNQVTSAWSAIIGHYANGLDFNRLSVVNAADNEATVMVPGRGRDGEALIRLRCLRSADGDWRVSRVDFVPGRAAASQPTSSTDSHG